MATSPRSRSNIRGDGFRTIYAVQIGPDLVVIDAFQKGHLDGLHAIRVNQRWRLIFRWDGARGEAKDDCLDDHSYP
jgi:hypothetical protein